MGAIFLGAGAPGIGQLADIRVIEMIALTGVAAGSAATAAIVTARMRSDEPEIHPADWVTLTRALLIAGVAGLFADRALSRGAWIAPANQPMRGVVSLDPPINQARRLDLQEARINLVRQEPRGFLVLDAETLSDDSDLIQMNVRRLLILLRRQALRLGATYVFEPNSPAFRRAVDVGFTNMLDRMFERGAFAGATPAAAYQVVTDASLNTPQSVDQGRFIVELRVAPSVPMTFLTIRLVQAGDRTSVTEAL